MSAEPAAPLKRKDICPDAIFDGRPAPNGETRRRFERLPMSNGEDEKAEQQWIRTLAGVSRAEHGRADQPAGRVGKTTSTFLVGVLLATHLKLRVRAIDAKPGQRAAARVFHAGRRVRRHAKRGQ